MHFLAMVSSKPSDPTKKAVYCLYLHLSPNLLSHNEPNPANIAFEGRFKKFKERVHNDNVHSRADNFRS